jgi:raffinose/stachyose/melibiose transport system permease protein
MSYFILFSFSFIVIVPILLLLAAALSPLQSGQMVLSDLQWSNFIVAWKESDFGSHLLVSITICVFVVSIVLIIAPLAAFALAILKVPGSRIIFVIILAGLMIPLESILVPLYFTMRSLPIASSSTALIIAHIGLNISFGVFWMRAAFLAIPVSLIESAVIDGATSFKIYRMIVLPLAAPAMITLGLLTFLWTWNDYFLAFILITNPDGLPVTVALGDFATRYSNKYNLMSATAVMVALPIVLLYIFFQRRFLEGVLSGALKG